MERYEKVKQDREAGAEALQVCECRTPSPLRFPCIPLHATAGCTHLTIIAYIP